MAMQFHKMIKEDQQPLGNRDDLVMLKLLENSEHHYGVYGGYKTLCGNNFHTDNIDERVLEHADKNVNCPVCKAWMSTSEWQMRVIRENIIRHLLKIIIPLNDWLEKKCKKHKWLNWLLS